MNYSSRKSNSCSPRSYSNANFHLKALSSQTSPMYNDSGETVSAGFSFRSPAASYDVQGPNQNALPQARRTKNKGIANFFQVTIHPELDFLLQNCGHRSPTHSVGVTVTLTLKENSNVLATLRPSTSISKEPRKSASSVKSKLI